MNIIQYEFLFYYLVKIKPEIKEVYIFEAEVLVFSFIKPNCHTKLMCFCLDCEEKCAK